MCDNSYTEKENHIYIIIRQNIVDYAFELKLIKLILSRIIIKE